ncbi:metal-dependent hydrolase [Acuticoccus yangtzensis]|uniref:metal-dependent hydrolase n=1 Tax=Acuticoccus yangtzensis TaxID=1443441 RepID=UPI0009497D5B|nr:metal-dependent hydrolase [Acuticoccus yangtzensis]
MDIIPRNIHFGISAEPRRRWFDDDLVKTAAVDAFSIFLPEGERFFIRSLRHYSGKLANEELDAEIKGYAVQEAYHTREHEDYNVALRELGYDIDGMEATVRHVLGRVKRPLDRLLVTCAIEQITYGTSKMMLKTPDLFANSAGHYACLWIWHAVEELEHSAVAPHVLEAATPEMSGLKRYILRTVTMAGVLALFYKLWISHTVRIAVANGRKRDMKLYGRIVYLLFISPGLLRRTSTGLARYFLPFYDPVAPEDAGLLAAGRKRLDALLETTPLPQKAAA